MQNFAWKQKIKSNKKYDEKYHYLFGELVLMDLSSHEINFPRLNGYAEVYKFSFEFKKKRREMNTSLGLNRKTVKHSIRFSFSLLILTRLMEKWKIKHKYIRSHRLKCVWIFQLLVYMLSCMHSIFHGY